eukprot:2531316-Rhodomonas_salina.3
MRPSNATSGIVSGYPGTRVRRSLLVRSAPSPVQTACTRGCGPVQRIPMQIAAVQCVSWYSAFVRALGARMCYERRPLLRKCVLRSHFRSSTGFPYGRILLDLRYDLARFSEAFGRNVFGAGRVWSFRALCHSPEFAFR